MRTPFRRPKPVSLEELNRQVEAWNAKYAPGIAVEVKRDNGTTFRTTTQSEAWVMGGHSAMIRVEGINGGYLLQRVSAATLPVLGGVA